MKVIYQLPDNEALHAAIKLSKEASDGCFSVSELSAYLNLQVEIVQQHVDKFVDWGVCGTDKPSLRTIDERWRLNIPYPSLTEGKEYEVLGIEADSYRILDDTNGPYCFKSICFKVIESKEPEFWVCDYGEDGERYCYPPEWQGYFFEDYFDYVKKVRVQFWNDLKKYYPGLAKKRV